MNKPLKLAAILILVAIGGGLVISACASAAAAQPKSDLEARVSTAAAATLIQYMVETQVAAQAVALAAEPALQATQTPLPSPTPVPTKAAPPTAAPTATASQPAPTSPPAAAPATGPTIIAEQNTNCRAGPSTAYRVVAYFVKGAESTVEGRDAGKDWWYIVNPDASSGYCWVWDGSTTVVGDTSTLPVVAAPAAPKTKDSRWYCSRACFYPNSWCGSSVYHCGFYPCSYNDCWQTSNWWGCTCTEWTCPPGWKNIWKPPWKESNCPPVTQVNYKKYCKNYPQCCD